MLYLINKNKAEKFIGFIFFYGKIIYSDINYYKKNFD